MVERDNVSKRLRLFSDIKTATSLETLARSFTYPKANYRNFVKHKTKHPQIGVAPKYVVAYLISSGCMKCVERALYELFYILVCMTTKTWHTWESYALVLPSLQSLRV